MGTDNKFCAKCPRRLGNPPTEPCPLALERINAQIADKRADEDTLPGCPWAINSAEHAYCFWNLSPELEDDPRTDKEICQFLNITPATLDKIWNSIIQKLKEKRGDPEIEHWIEHLKDSVDSKAVDDTVYYPDNFRSTVENANNPNDDEGLDDEAKLAKELDEAADEKDKAEKRKRKLKKTGQVIHRSGLRVDMYGIYSKKTLERIRNEKKK